MIPLPPPSPTPHTHLNPPPAGLDSYSISLRGRCANGKYFCPKTEWPEVADLQRVQYPFSLFEILNDCFVTLHRIPLETNRWDHFVQNSFRLKTCCKATISNLVNIDEITYSIPSDSSCIFRLYMSLRNTKENHSCLKKAIHLVRQLFYATISVDSSRNQCGSWWPDCAQPSNGSATSPRAGNT